MHQAPITLQSPFTSILAQTPYTPHSNTTPTLCHRNATPTPSENICICTRDPTNNKQQQVSKDYVVYNSQQTQQKATLKYTQQRAKISK